MAESVDGNEHALKWVINQVDGLCDEFDKIGDIGDVRAQMHLELSAVKILDELETSTINHAKQEVLLLLRLDDSLAILTTRCQRILDKPDLIDRLKKFRDEIRRIFMQAQAENARTLLGMAARRPSPSARDRIDRATTTNAERTTTPEAGLIGYERDRTSRVATLSTSRLIKLRDKISKSESESTDTKATRTPIPGNGEKSEERSQRIWIPDDEDRDGAMDRFGPEAAFQRRFGSQPAASTIQRSENARATADQDGWDRIPVPCPDFMGSDGSEKSSGCSVRIMRVPPVAFANTVEEENLGEGGGYDLSLSFVLTVIVVPLVLLWWIISILELDRHRSPRRVSHAYLLVWQLICGVINPICEHFGFACFDYCCSGIQREKWGR